MPGDRELRASFDEVAADYQDARPDYPGQLYTDLLQLKGLRAPAALLEVGCGPGKATLPLARMGFSITALELGPALAEEARRRLSQFARVSVVNAAFEDWRPPADLRFDLVYAATAWKWIDPSSRYQHAADTLRRGGHLAVWAAGHAFPRPFDPSSPRSSRFTTRLARAKFVGRRPNRHPNSKPREKWKRLAFSSQFSCVTTYGRVATTPIVISPC